MWILRQLRRWVWTRSIRAAKPLLARPLQRQSVGALTGRAAFPSHGLRSRIAWIRSPRRGAATPARDEGQSCRAFRLGARFARESGSAVPLPLMWDAQRRSPAVADI